MAKGEGGGRCREKSEEHTGVGREGADTTVAGQASWVAMGQASKQTRVHECVLGYSTPSPT